MPSIKINTVRLCSITAALLLLCSNIACTKLFVPPVDGQKAFDNKSYHLAAQLLENDYNKSSDNTARAALAETIGDACRLSNQTAAAESWYAKAAEHSSNPELPFKYALMLKSNEKYEQALQQFKEYAANNPVERAKAKVQIIACQQALQWLKEKNAFISDNLVSVNSPASDFAPVVYNRNSLVFTSARAAAQGNTYDWTGEQHSDLFVADRNGAADLYTAAVAFGDSLNTPYNEGTATFSADNNTVYFTQCGSENKNDDYCHIYRAFRKENNRWSRPELVLLFEADSINTGQPFLSADGKLLYFAAAAPDGFGDKDLYVSELLKDGSWGYPRNLGADINTAGYEGFPYIDKNGTLYFASDGHDGMGGLDIFSAEKNGKRWTNVQNLKAPLNSGADDFALTLIAPLNTAALANKTPLGYFSSSRRGGMGNDDIYVLSNQIPATPPPTDTIPAKTDTLPPAIAIYLKGEILQKVFEDDTNPQSRFLRNAPLPNAAVQILGLNLESTLSTRFTADENGRFFLPVEANSEYRVFAEAPTFFSRSETVKSGAQSDTIEVQIVLDRIFKQQQVVIPNIYYDLDKSDIRADAQPVLDEVVKLLKENPRIVVEFGSHTDSRGSDAYNEELSQARAQAVVTYLSSKGVDARRLLARGYGETQLVNRCANGVACSEEEHQENRRTTFKVLSDNFRE